MQLSTIPRSRKPKTRTPHMQNQCFPGAVGEGMLAQSAESIQLSLILKVLATKTLKTNCVLRFSGYWSCRPCRPCGAWLARRGLGLTFSEGRSGSSGVDNPGGRTNPSSSVRIRDRRPTRRGQRGRRIQCAAARHRHRAARGDAQRSAGTMKLSHC